MLLSGKDLSPVSQNAEAVSYHSHPLILEAASRLNLAENPESLIQVEGTARSFEKADALSRGVKDALVGLLLGDPTRVRAIATVKPDAPEGGNITIQVPPPADS